MIKIKSLFEFFIFLNFFVLCCDSNNNTFFYITIAGLLITVILYKKIEKQTILSEINVWNYLFVIYSMMSIFWSISFDDSKEMVLLLIKRTILIFPLSVFLRKREDIEKILKIYLITNFLMMIKISIGILNGHAGMKMWDEITGNYFNTVAQFLSIGIAIAYYFFSQEKSTKTLKYFCIAFIIFALYHIYLTGSRKGLIMPIIEIIIFRIVKGGLDYKEIFKNILMFSLGILIITIFLVNNPLIMERFNILLEMFLESKTGDESTVLRQYYIELAGEMFNENPIFGNGINTFPYILQSLGGGYRYCHNNYMEILSGTGIIGLILYYWFYIKICVDLFQMRHKNNISILGFCIIITLMFFEYGIVSYSVFMYPIILSIFSRVKNCERNRKEYNNA